MNKAYHNPAFDPNVDGSDPSDRDEANEMITGGGYSRLRRKVVLATTLVAVVPLVIMTVLNFSQYDETIERQKIQSINRLLSNNKRTLEFFLSERRSALSYLGREHPFDDLCNNATLGRIIRDMNDSFSTSMFVDLGIIDSKGRQRCYSGPHNLQGRSYLQHVWFIKAIQQGTYTSPVFLGHRNSPHFAIATRHNRNDDDYFLIRATFDAEALSRQIHTAGLHFEDDIFLMDRDGVLQTRSRLYGKVLSKVPLALPHGSSGVEVAMHQDEHGRPLFLGYAGIEDSPFVLAFARQANNRIGGWKVPARLLGFLFISSTLVLLVILWGAGQFVSSLKSANRRRLEILRKAENSNKLASVGRLAAGVAHEINNPLAIINENSGLIKDLILLREDFPDREQFLELIEVVLGSVTRCKTITHRLLGFAKHMDVKNEVIDVALLVKEVMGFLEKEMAYRNIHVEMNNSRNLSNIYSDRGQLLQVFLNLLNNAVSAVSDRGNIHIDITHRDPNWIAVAIKDDGIGIKKENLQRIFEPFFTTKEGTGTGLGLSITYGIVHKLGGKITVESEKGKGTCFSVLLPMTEKKGGRE